MFDSLSTAPSCHFHIDHDSGINFVLGFYRQCIILPSPLINEVIGQPFFPVLVPECVSSSSSLPMLIPAKKEAEAGSSSEQVPPKVIHIFHALEPHPEHFCNMIVVDDGAVCDDVRNTESEGFKGTVKLQGIQGVLDAVVSLVDYGKYIWGTNNDSWQGKLPWDPFLAKLCRPSHGHYSVVRSWQLLRSEVLCILVGILEAQVMTEDALLSSLSKPAEAVEAVWLQCCWMPKCTAVLHQAGQWPAPPTACVAYVS